MEPLQREQLQIVVIDVGGLTGLPDFCAHRPPPSRPDARLWSFAQRGNRRERVLGLCFMRIGLVVERAVNRYLLGDDPVEPRLPARLAADSQILAGVVVTAAAHLVS